MDRELKISSCHASERDNALLPEDWTYNAEMPDSLL